MPTCKQMTELASDRIEGALGFLERRRFDRHLAGCGACRAYFRQLEATVRTLRRIPGPEASPRLNDTIMAQFDSWASARTPGLAAPASADAGASRRFTFWPAATAAATLALLVAFARNRSRAPDDWLVGASLGAAALAMASLAGRYAVKIVVAAVLAAVAAALYAGRGDALDVATGTECLGLELVAAAAVAGAAWLQTRGGSRAWVRRSLAASGVAGALAADAALQISCPVHDALPHLLTFHVGGVVLVAAAATFALRRSAGRVSA